jgi:hypothetical protein
LLRSNTAPRRAGRSTLGFIFVDLTTFPLAS